MMKVHIYCKTMDKGLTLLEKIKEDTVVTDILCVKESYFGASLELKSGTIYQVVVASEAARAYRCHFAYIDNEIDKEIIDQVLIPTIIYPFSGAKRYEYF